MVTIKIDRRALYVLVGLVVLLVPLGLGVLLGRQASQSNTAQSPAPAAPAAAPTLQLSALSQSAPGAAAQMQLPTPDATLAALPRISVDEAAARLGQPDAVFVDVRAIDQYQQGHIKDALSIPELEMTSRMAELPRDKEIILYCA